jgi:hypothetical protein
MKKHWRLLLSILPESLERKGYEGYFQKMHHAWVAENCPVPVSYVTKHSAIRKAAQKYHIKTLVETGTYLGDTMYMLYPDFDALYSIELSPIFHNRAKKRFRSMPNIHLLQGDSGKEMAKLVTKLKAPALFWLDGHYSGGITAKGDKECPVLEELDAIFRSAADHVIYIDDARLFNGQHDYPTIEEVKNIVAAARPNYMVKVENDCIQITPECHD